MASKDYTVTSRKRLFETGSQFDEYESVSEIRSPTKFAKVHGVLTSMSPMHKSPSGCHYFDGSLSDGAKSVRVVGFDSKVQQRLMDFHSRKEPVALVNCEVKQGKYSADLELHTRKITDVLKSPVKIDAAAIVTNLPSDLITLDELPRLENFQTVSVNVKVLHVKTKEEVKKGLVKQDCYVGDATGTAKLTLWENNVGLIVEDQCYTLSGIKVRSFKGEKYLSIPKDGFSYVPIDDIGVVQEKIDDIHILHNVEIRAVKYFDAYKGCLTCSGKVSPTTDTIGKCNRCESIQRLDKCTNKITAKIEVANTADFKTLTCFTPIINDIIGSGDATVESLLFCAPFSAEYTTAAILTKVIRP